MNEKKKTAAGTSFEIFDLGRDGVAMALAEVSDTTSGVFDTPRGTLNVLPVPGRRGESYVPFGDDDQLPFRIIDLVGQDEVSAQNKLFNVLTCYGAGLKWQFTEDTALSVGENVRRWSMRQSLPQYFIDQITDMKYFYYSVVVFILSRDGKQINRIVHKEACYCRLAPADKRGHIPYVYYGNWRDGAATKSGVERVELLDQRDPLGDLYNRLGRDYDGTPNPARTATTRRKFAMLLRFPTAGCQYYPTPYWASVFRGGSYDEKRLISAGKRAKLKNHSSVKYLVEVEHGYWDRMCDDEGIFDEVEKLERIRQEKENIREFTSGLDNSNKVWVSGFYINPDGATVSDVKITSINNAKEGGDWSDDVQAAANTLCYADNVHPNLVGAVPGKSQTNNSGSDKRELFTMKQALETAWHDLLLLPLHVVAEFNGWHGVQPCVPMIQLTTLDEHRDAKEVTA